MNMGDLPDSVIGPSRNNSGDDETSNATDFFLNFSEQKGVVENSFQNLSRTSAINNLMDNKKKEEGDREKNEKERIIRNEKIIRIAQPPKKLQPRVGLQKIASELYRAQKQTQKANDEVEDLYKNRQVAPVARQISEWFLRGMGWKIMEMEVLKKFPDKKTVADAIEFIKELADPILLISGLATFPALYDNCEKCRKFLIDNHIRIRYVIPIQKCADCKHKNSLGTCSFFGAKIFCIWIDDEDCKDVITELFANNKLTSSQCQALTEIPDAKDRLLKAVKLAACPPEKRTDWTRPIRNEKMNSLALSTANFDQRENAVKWGIEKLSSGKTVTEIREMIAGKCQDSVGIVNDAIARMKIISANSLDACLSEQYIVSPNLEFVKANKCEVCRHAGPISCNRHNLIFSTTMLSLSGLNEQSPEAEEISSYFSDSKFEVDIKPPPKKPSLDIELDNLGKDMEVDVGKKSNIGENLDVGTILNDIPELVVDLLPAPQHSDELSVSGLEEQTGFDLTDLL